VKLKAI